MTDYFFIWPISIVFIFYFGYPLMLIISTPKNNPITCIIFLFFWPLSVPYLGFRKEKKHKILTTIWLFASILILPFILYSAEGTIAKFKLDQKKLEGISDEYEKNPLGSEHIPMNK